MHALKRISILLVLCLSPLQAWVRANEPATLQQAESLLKDMFCRLANTGNDKDKITLADSIAGLLQQTLLLAGSFDYPFDLIQNLGKISSSDRKLRIYTWNIPAGDGTNTYYGFLQYRTDNTGDGRIYRLTDKRYQITDPLMATLAPDNWYGCLIYEIIEKKQPGVTYYTLLGYNPENLFVSKKVVDLLFFNEQGEPSFGKAIFHVQKNLQCRIIFEYSAKVKMSLAWNERLNMIVFDHLSPSKPSYTGNYQFYGPDLSYDGLRFENGVWEIAEDIDVRNNNK
jgi:hypothetical protein